MEIDKFGRDRALSYDDINNFPYCRAVILETLRLYTPDVNNYRRTDSPIKLNQYTIPRDSRLILSTTGVHHDERVWPKCEEFIPERFIDADEYKS